MKKKVSLTQILPLLLVAVLFFTIPFYEGRHRAQQDKEEAVREAERELYRKLSAAIDRCGPDQKLTFKINGVTLRPPAMAVGGAWPVTAAELEKDVCTALLLVSGVVFMLRQPVMESYPRSGEVPGFVAEYRKLWKAQHLADAFRIFDVNERHAYSLIRNLKKNNLLGPAEERIHVDFMNVPQGYAVYSYARGGYWVLSKDGQDLFIAGCSNNEKFFRRNNQNLNCRFSDFILNDQLQIQYRDTFSPGRTDAHEPVDLFNVHLSTIAYVTSLVAE